MSAQSPPVNLPPTDSSDVTSISRPYEDVPASQLADMLEGQYSQGSLDEAIATSFGAKLLAARTRERQPKTTVVHAAFGD